MSLSPADALKLSKILALLSSSHDGERANAGAAADQFIADRGLQWADVIATKLPPRGRARADAKQSTSSTVPPWSAKEKFEYALRHMDQLTMWEKGFVGDDWYDWQKPLTPKQEKCLDKIVVKLWEAGCR